MAVHLLSIAYLVADYLFMLACSLFIAATLVHAGLFSKRLRQAPQSVKKIITRRLAIKFLWVFPTAIAGITAVEIVLINHDREVMLPEYAYQITSAVAIWTAWRWYQIVRNDAKA